MKITWVLTHRKVRGKVVPKYYIKECYENKTVREKKRDETVSTKQIQSRGEITGSLCLDQ